MGDKNFEEEFNRFFGGKNSLINKLGEERAKKIFELLKNLKERGIDDDGMKLFSIPNPLTSNVKPSIIEDKIERENPEVIRTWEDGNLTIKTIWRDDNDAIIKVDMMVIQNLDDENSPPFDDSIINKIISMSGNLNEGDKLFINSEGVTKLNETKNKRTLEGLLAKVVEVEDYTTASLVRDFIKKEKKFIDTYWEEMLYAAKQKKEDDVYKLLKLKKENDKLINDFLTQFERFFNDN